MTKKKILKGEKRCRFLNVNCSSDSDSGHYQSARHREIENQNALASLHSGQVRYNLVNGISFRKILDINSFSSKSFKCNSNNKHLMIMSNPKQHSFPGPQFVTSNKLSTKKIKSEDGFAKIIAGGRIVRPDPHKPEIERMVIGDKFNYKNNSVPSSHERAV